MKSFLSDILFFLSLAALLALAAAFGTGSGAPRSFFGFSCFTVLTSSMQDEIPKGSLIFVQHRGGDEIHTGDTITCMREANVTVTHKVLAICENYENSGARGFLTQGVNNASPDPDIALESNVIGVVLFSVPMMGSVMSYLSQHIYLVLILLGLCLLLLFSRQLWGKPIPPLL